MNKILQTYCAYLILIMSAIQIVPTSIYAASDDEIMYPLKEMSKLECRFEEFDTLSADCKQNFLVLQSKDYNKYATLDGGYNDYTRIYTVLWGSSYKYGWDVGSGGHQGTDIATAKGTPVYAIANGTVIESGNNPSWGNHVSIEHTIRGKKVVSNYAHFSKILVNKGEKVQMGKKIGEVGSTGNSTGNHLHFQIDLSAPFHPYYYDYKVCPYSYYEITEKGVCFDELAKNTLDPLVFLESNGAILDSVRTSTSNTVNKPSQNTYKNNIFDTTVYYGYGSTDDIREVQKVMKELGYYTGNIDGVYSSVEPSITEFQLKLGVINSGSDDGAGWFGPKTRKVAQAQYLALGGSTQIPNKTENNTTIENNTDKVITETVSREKLLTREEIEAREMAEFERLFKINFSNPISQISENEKKVTKIEITDLKGRGFQGSTPADISFQYDETKISIFPKSFFNFIDGQRDITITGLKPGHTTVSVKIGQKEVKTFSISVGKRGENPGVDTAEIFMNSEVVIGEGKTGIVLMKDQYDNKLIRNSYAGKFSIKATGNTKIQYCVKKGTLGDIYAVYKRSCYDEEYKDTLNFSYTDTIAGLLIFDYRTLSTDTIKFSVTNNSKNLVEQSVVVKTPKGLDRGYVYYDNVMEVLKSGIANGVTQGYFLEDKDLSQKDAVDWIKNILKNTGKLDTNKEIYKEANSRYTYVSREDLLELSYKYLGKTNQSTLQGSYRDLEDTQVNKLAQTISGNYKWKDDFGKNYFQPDKKVTRGEAAYFLTQTQVVLGNSSIARK